MGALMNDLWPFMVTAIISVVGTYFALVREVKERMAVAEVKINSLEARVNKHSAKYDDILTMLGDIKSDLARISTTLNIIEPKKERHK